MAKKATAVTKRKGRAVHKTPKAMARLDPDLLAALSVLARALNIPQYQALDDAVRDWIEKHKGACAARVFETSGRTPPRGVKPLNDKKKAR